MEPATVIQIKEWDRKLDDKAAKKLFLRSEAIKAYKSENADEAISNLTTATVKDAIDSIFVSVGKMSKDNIGLLIGNLEDARAILATLGQGFQIAFAEEKEPEFRKKALERSTREKAQKGGKLSIEESLAKLGLNFSKLMESIPVNGIAETVETPKPEPNKITCEKCQKVMLAAMAKIHKC